MKISLVIWLMTGQGIIYKDYQTWDKCEKVMAALNKVEVDATCHLTPVHERR